MQSSIKRQEVSLDLIEEIGDKKLNSSGSNATTKFYCIGGSNKKEKKNLIEYININTPTVTSYINCTRDKHVQTKESSMMEGQDLEINKIISKKANIN